MTAFICIDKIHFLLSFILLDDSLKILGCFFICFYIKANKNSLPCAILQLIAVNKILYSIIAVQQQMEGILLWKTLSQFFQQQMKHHHNKK